MFFFVFFFICFDIFRASRNVRHNQLLAAVAASNTTQEFYFIFFQRISIFLFSSPLFSKYNAHSPSGERGKMEGKQKKRDP